MIPVIFCLKFPRAYNSFPYRQMQAQVPVLLPQSVPEPGFRFGRACC